MLVISHKIDSFGEGNFMPKKIQRKPIKYLPVKVDSTQAKTREFSFQGAITILGGLTGLIVAILWQAGRFYTAGYFSAMNIPSSQISFSTWEYAEVSWFRLIVYFIDILDYPLLAISTGLIAFYTSIYILQKLAPGLKLSKAITVITTTLKTTWMRAKGAIGILIGLYFFYLLTLSFVDMKNFGNAEGQRAVLSQSYAVEIFSKEALPIGPATIAPDTTFPLFHYEGLKLLTYNNEKYYLFRDIDPITCKPEQVFVVDNLETIYVVIGEISPDNGTCSGALASSNSSDSP